MLIFTIQIGKKGVILFFKILELRIMRDWR